MSYTWNKQCLMKDGKPWFPVMGEMHYSRYREDLWEESLRKMKAGGLDIVASYVIWIHHEEEEGKFTFEGSCNIRKFAQLCQKVGLQFFLRLGPWCHGEVRNGGFPDWLMQKGLVLRSNDAEYLKYVGRMWKAIYSQVEGLMYEDGGPIVGVQIENEYGHAGGFGGEEGEEHMRTLTRMAKEIGFAAPYYTATGWGGAVTGGLLPVMGGYCEAPWDQRFTEIEANDNYIFTNERNDANIANDYNITHGLTFNPADFPYLTAELGGGLQPTHHRRPVTTGKDIGAMSLTKLGSGVALLGYYMYHGGSNPIGKYSTFEESRATGSPNDLPVINYDFCGPIRQYGQISDTYKEIKLLALFLRDFGGEMAVLPAEIEKMDIIPEDMETLRLSWRHNEKGGFVFYNNYQRKRNMQEHKDVKLYGKCGAAGCADSENVEFPAFDMASGEYGFFPYNWQLGEAVLTSALATPLCRLEGEETCYVFYGSREPEFAWKDGKSAKTLHISRQDALNAWKVSLDKDYLVLSENYVWEEDGRSVKTLHVTGGRECTIKAYPKMPAPAGFAECGEDGVFTLYRKVTSGAGSSVQVRSLDENQYEITVEYGKNIKDCILELTYAGDSAQIYIEETLVNDHFYTGQKLELSMRYFDFPKRLRAVITPLEEGAPCFLEKWPQMENGRACRLERVEMREECW